VKELEEEMDEYGYGSSARQSVIRQHLNAMRHNEKDKASLTPRETNL
jgi:hypothetical protein